MARSDLGQTSYLSLAQKPMSVRAKPAFSGMRKNRNEGQMAMVLTV